MLKVSHEGKILEGLADYHKMVREGASHEEALQELDSYMHPILVAEIEKRLAEADTKGPA